MKNKKAKHPTMHPRNIYNKKHHFKDLALEFPEFKANTTIDVSGRIRLDFKNPEALRAFSKTLLKKDFDLDVDFPITSLIPTIPLRLNYILFIEDILNLADIKENVRVLDIGTGASCVYPLMAAKKFGWSMTGTDINHESISYAKKNVETNKLEHLINVVEVKKDTIISEVLEKDDNEYDICMCNPPFFGNLDELSAPPKNRPNRQPPNNAFTGSKHEVITEGGEIEFVSKLIEESFKWNHRIKIFTSMVGIKRSLAPLLAKLRNMDNVKSVATTEFYQGHTTRYGIAWTFNESINLGKLSRSIRLPKESKNKPYVYNIKGCNRSLEEVDVKIREIFEELQFNYKELESCIPNTKNYNITVHRNTWSHNRQKQRNQMQKSNEKGCEIAETSKDNSNPNVEETLKRKSDDCEDTGASSKKVKDDETEGNKNVIFLECAVSLNKIESEVTFEFLYICGAGGKSGTHDILQYIKNHLQLK